MSRGFCLFVVVIGLVGFVAADFDLNAAAADLEFGDLLFKAKTEQQGGPQTVAPQRALLSSRGLSATSPPKKKPCFPSTTPSFFRYRVKFVTDNRLVKEYYDLADDFAEFYLFMWPEIYDLPDITPFRNAPILAKTKTQTTWGISVRVYLTPLNLERCPTSKAQDEYKQHIARRAREKLTAFKSKKVISISLF